MECVLTFVERGDRISDEMEFEITSILKQYSFGKWKLKEIVLVLNEKFGKQWQIFKFPMNTTYSYYFMSTDEEEDKECSGHYLKYTQGIQMIIIFKT